MLMRTSASTPPDASNLQTFDKHMCLRMYDALQASARFIPAALPL